MMSLHHCCFWNGSAWQSMESHLRSWIATRRLNWFLVIILMFASQNVAFCSNYFFNRFFNDNHFISNFSAIPFQIFYRFLFQLNYFYWINLANVWFTVFWDFYGLMMQMRPIWVWIQNCPLQMNNWSGFVSNY